MVHSRSRTEVSLVRFTVHRCEFVADGFPFFFFPALFLFTGKSLEEERLERMGWDMNVDIVWDLSLTDRMSDVLTDAFFSFFFLI